MIMLNWAIIGSGGVVQRLVQDSLFKKNKSDVKYILSEDFSSAKKFGKIHNIDFILLKNKKNLNKILQDKKINSIYIATPPSSHFFYINYFCKKKINIVCEKPLIINKKEINLLKNLIKKYKFNLFTCFYRRYLERFLYIKKILQKKSLGKVLYFDIKFFHSNKNHPTHNIIKGKPIPWRFVKEISGGGNVFDMGVHAIDLIEFMIGKVKKVSSYKTNKMKFYNVEDVCVLNFELDNKILGQSSWCSVSNKKIDEFSIYGSKASIHFCMNLGYDNRVRIIKNEKTIVKKINMKQPLHKNMFKNFINELILNNKNNKYKIYQNGITNALLLDKISN